jgi:hypothetical protein
VQFGGLTVGEGGLVVERSGSNPITASLFGTRLSGGTATGGEAFFRATFGEAAPAGTFTEASQLNLFGINSGNRTIAPVEAPPSAAITSTLPPPADFDQLALEQDGGGGEEGGGAGSGFGSARQFLVDLRALSRAELIDDPVAGASDSTTWMGEEDQDEEEEEEGGEASDESAAPAGGDE